MLFCDLKNVEIAILHRDCLQISSFSLELFAGFILSSSDRPQYTLRLFFKNLDGTGSLRWKIDGPNEIKLNEGRFSLKFKRAFLQFQIQIFPLHNWWMDFFVKFPFDTFTCCRSLIKYFVSSAL